MYAVKKGTAERPAHTSARKSAADKYPFATMAVNDYFVVPKTEMTSTDDAKKFRNRVHQAAQSFARRYNNNAALLPGYDEKTYKPLVLTVITLGAPDASKGQDWEEGDVGVWRDA